MPLTRVDNEVSTRGLLSLNRSFFVCLEYSLLFFFSLCLYRYVLKSCNYLFFIILQTSPFIRFETSVVIGYESPTLQSFSCSSFLFSAAGCCPQMLQNDKTRLFQSKMLAFCKPNIIRVCNKVKKHKQWAQHLAFETSKKTLHNGWKDGKMGACFPNRATYNRARIIYLIINNNL